MDHLHSLINYIQATETRPGFISLCTCIISAVIAFLNAFAFIDLTHSLHYMQMILAIVASGVAIVSGGFAIAHYRLQIRKSKTTL